MNNEALTRMTTTSAAQNPIGAREDSPCGGSRPGPDRHPPVERPGSDIFKRVGLLGLAAGCALAVSGCVTPQEQRAMDQRQCYEFGFETRTDGFAQCMMDLSQQRAQIQADRDMQLRSQLAEQSRRRDAQQDLYKILSLQRSNDKSFPVCGASSDGGMDRTTMTWYGPNCRSR